MTTQDSRLNDYLNKIQSLNGQALYYPDLLHIFDSAIIGIELNSKKNYVLVFSVHKMLKIASEMGVYHNDVLRYVRRCIPHDLLSNEHSPLFRYADHRDTIGKQLVDQLKLFDYDLLVSNYCEAICFQKNHSDSCDCICHTFTCSKCKCVLKSKVRLFTCPSCSFGFTPDKNNEMELVVVGFEFLEDLYIREWPELFKKLNI